MDTTLRKLQQIQLDMLKAVDAFCRENGVRYSLFGGTLLGAVRHQGFIPWDDDLDICMARKDYDRFLSLWAQTKHPGLILQNKENTPTFTQSFTKIRKDNTAFVQADWEAGLYHNGIFIDIFPIDRIPDGRLARYLFRWRCMRYQLYTREFVPEENGLFLKAGSRLLLALKPKKGRARARQGLLKKITARDDDRTLSPIGIEVFRSLNRPYPVDMLENYVELPFEDMTCSCFAQWDEMLRRIYGDYQQLPPESERTWRHHPTVLNFEHNYEDLKKD
ncbi:MAG: LicD family protein [Oscillospiraceae bacterium]|nr:LicD family protein [Oscillospiraceae bacterium]